MSEDSTSQRPSSENGFASTVEEIPEDARREARQRWESQQRQKAGTGSTTVSGKTSVPSWFLVLALVTVGAGLLLLALAR
jgi:hypothetical protein